RVIRYQLSALILLSGGLCSRLADKPSAMVMGSARSPRWPYRGPQPELHRPASCAVPFCLVRGRMTLRLRGHAGGASEDTLVTSEQSALPICEGVRELRLGQAPKLNPQRGCPFHASQALSSLGAAAAAD